MPVAHHDLCFGCGLANVFGLHLELEAEDAGAAGRFFVKQDDQGPPGHAHGGIIGAALDEAMALALHGAGIHARTRRYEVELEAPAPVGTWVAIRARLEREEGRKLWLRATASGEEGTIAEAAGLFVRVDDDRGGGPGA